MEKFKWFPRIKASLDTSIGNPSLSSLKQVMFLLLRDVSHTVDNCISKRKPKRATLLHKSLRTLMLHFHISYKGRIKQISDTEKPTFHDAMAALGSLTLDLNVFLAANEPEKSSKYISQALQDVLLYLGQKPQYIWDVIIQSSSLRDTELHTYTAPLLRCLMKNAPKVAQNPEQFTKSLLATWCWLEATPQESEKKNIESYALKATPPEGFSTWFLSLPIQILQALEPGTSTKKLLKLLFQQKFMAQIFNQLCEILSEDMPTAFEDCSAMFQVDEEKDLESNVFVIDKKGSSDRNDTFSETEQSEEADMHLELFRTIESLPAMLVPSKYNEDVDQSSRNVENSDHHGTKKQHRRPHKSSSETTTHLSDFSPAKKLKMSSLVQEVESLSTQLGKPMTENTDDSCFVNESEDMNASVTQQQQQLCNNSVPCVVNRQLQEFYSPMLQGGNDDVQNKLDESDMSMHDIIPSWLQNSTCADVTDIKEDGGDDNYKELGKGTVEVNGENENITAKSDSEVNDETQPVTGDSDADNNNSLRKDSYGSDATDKVNKEYLHLSDGDKLSRNVPEFTLIDSISQRSINNKTCIENELGNKDDQENIMKELGNKDDTSSGVLLCDNTDLGDDMLHSPSFKQRTQLEKRTLEKESSSPLHMSPLKILSSSSESPGESPERESYELRVPPTMSSPNKQVKTDETFVDVASPKAVSPDNSELGISSSSKLLLTKPCHVKLSCLNKTTLSEMVTSPADTYMTNASTLPPSSFQKLPVRKSPKKYPSHENLMIIRQNTPPKSPEKSPSKTLSEKSFISQEMLFPKQFPSKGKVDRQSTPTKPYSAMLCKVGKSSEIMSPSKNSEPKALAGKEILEVVNESSTLPKILPDDILKKSPNKSQENAGGCSNKPLNDDQEQKGLISSNKHTVNQEIIAGADNSSSLSKVISLNSEGSNSKDKTPLVLRSRRLPPQSEVRELCESSSKWLKSNANNSCGKKGYNLRTRTSKNKK